MPFVYSTATNPTDYCEWLVQSRDLPQKGRFVRINGGAGLAAKRTLLTPRGVGTEVTEDQLTFLYGLKEFNDHVKLGFITISKRRNDAEAMAANMSERDGSSPNVPADYAAQNLPVPVTDGSIASEITTKKRWTKSTTSEFTTG